MLVKEWGHYEYTNRRGWRFFFPLGCLTRGLGLGLTEGLERRKVRACAWCLVDVPWRGVLSTRGMR